MAEDCIPGFEFIEDDDIIRDFDVLKASDFLFKEAAYGGTAARDQMVEVKEAGLRGEDMHKVDPSGDFDNFDFNEGFDFIL